MKKGLIAIIVFMFAVPAVFGTIITNTNQSVMYVRLPARNASTSMDAVYYNPAGVMKLENGFHLAVHNQTIWQEKTIVNEFPLLKSDTYVGKAQAPVFPSLFIVYKQDKFALSFGAGINAGGGSADYDTGLPSFEIPIALLPALLSSMGVPTTQYAADINFSGLSFFLGFQGNIAYAINDVFAVAAGIRYIYAINIYEGYLENIQINPMHPLLNPSGGLISAQQFFTMAGMPQYAALVEDAEVDVQQTGSAITPILSLNIQPSDGLNIGIRYEFNTNLELTNDSTVDDTGMFPDGYAFRNDIPAILSVGIEYAPVPKLRLMVSYNQFFDTGANWDGAEEFVDSNSYDIGVGFEYDITDSFLISAGYLYTKVGVSADYQDDFAHELDSSLFGAGARIMLTPSISLDFGGMYVSYSEASRGYQRTDFPLPFAETYQRESYGFSIGLGFRL
jgi:long-chain fatty acid transport protein